MAEKRFYRAVSEELASGHVDAALMLKAKALSKGNEEAAQALYINLRVGEVRAAERWARWQKGVPVLAGMCSGAFGWAFLWLFLFALVGGGFGSDDGHGLSWWSKRFRDSWSGYPLLIFALLIGAVRGGAAVEEAGSGNRQGKRVHGSTDTPRLKS